MIEITRKDTEVGVRIDLELSCDRPVLFFTRNETYGYQAALLENRIKHLLEKKLSSIRKRAYEEGYKDAKAKRAKKTEFCPTWHEC